MTSRAGSSQVRLSDDEVEAVYGLGVALLGQERAEEAAHLLGCLLVVAPLAARVWQGLGTALHRMGELPAAAVALSMAALINGSAEPEPQTLAVLDRALEQLTEA